MLKASLVAVALLKSCPEPCVTEKAGVFLPPTKDTSITASITPSSTSNKILVFASVNGAGNVTASKQSYFSLYRDTTARIEWFSISGAAYNYNANSIGFLDSPSSTSALAYNIKIKSESGGTAVVGAYNSYSSLVLMEIKA